MALRTGERMRKRGIAAGAVGNKLVKERLQLCGELRGGFPDHSPHCLGGIFDRIKLQGFTIPGSEGIENLVSGP